MKFPEKPYFQFFSFLCVLCASVVSGFALDREAFSISAYNLDVQVEPEQHRLGARGKITLRNDTSEPQKMAVLQISSSLNWRSIKAGDKAVQFVTQPYTSDIDHTGSLSEAIVTLPQPILPKKTVDLDIAYEGTIVLDATRLTRIGTPDDAARNTDWDRIDATFTAVRGVGYVAWYPVATDVANLSEGNSLFEVLARWKTRETGATAHVKISYSRNSTGPPPKMVINEPSCILIYKEMGPAQEADADCTFRALGTVVLSFVVADYGEVKRTSLQIFNLPTHAAAAEMYADEAEKMMPFITGWFGPPREKAQTADLPDPNDTPFESRATLLLPLGDSNPRLAAAHQLTHASFSSVRLWIEEGLAHFAQALYLEQEKGRQAALDYMALHRSAIGQSEPASTSPRSEDEVNRALVNTINEELYRSKAMYVWWMLRDMLGDAALKKALAAYRPEQDKEPSYMPRLIASQTQRDLEWFFDDWVYRDRGLPDFKVISADARSTLTKSFITAITVENLGNAGAEVPVIVKFAGGEVTKRLEVPGKSKATIRVETPKPPQEVVVNDGSVPENDTTNNTFKVEAPKA